jgi:membrane peptidoglycan carboxypeptidase
LPAVVTLLRVIQRIASLGLLLVAVASVTSAAALTIIPQLGDVVTATESTSAELELDALAQRSTMYAADGSFMTLLVGEQNRESISLDEMPQEAISAILAMEDNDFYEHDGVNFRAVFRALAQNISAGGIEQGGSTITQQLVKNALLSSDQSFDRKKTEAFYALRLEEQFTKDEILERYLNTVYFGQGAYGLKGAAEVYFGLEDPMDMGWEEAALLAGLIRSPNSTNPVTNPQRARDRRATVVERLVSLELISESQGRRINLADLPEERSAPLSTKPSDYFEREAQKELQENPAIPIGDTPAERIAAIYSQGLQVYTTFDPAAQALAEQAKADLLPIDSRGFTLAMATVDNNSGAVLAMVGGDEFTREQFNLAVDGLRQPGSSMKTYVLAALFEAGYTPSDTVRGDSPCKFENPGGVPNPYEVKGGSGRRITIASATRASNNCAFVRLGQVVGNDNVIEVARRLGISTPLDAVLSLPLGSKEVRVIEQAAAYAAFINDGIYNKPWYIERIEDRNGNVIYERRPDGRRAVTVQTARMITQTLESNVRGGTGTRARLPNGMPAGGKTGTAQNSEDAWFVGFSPYVTTAVWMGHPDEKVPMRGVAGWGTIFGGTVPAAVWGQFNTAYHELLEAREFADPESYGGGRYLKVDSETDFCRTSDIGVDNEGTVISTDSDGNDCYVPITTTVLCPDGSPPPEEGECPPAPATTAPSTTAPPATPPPTEPPVTEPPPATEPPAEGG